MPVDVVRYEAPGWGVGELWFEGERLLYHELPRAATSPTAASRGHASRGQVLHSRSDVAMQDLTPRLVQRVQDYFRGERVRFDDVEVDLGWATRFQRSVAEELRRVPYGEVVTYGELAALAGYPNAQRAAGTFCAGNRFPLIVPCHRVVAASGLGSYGSLGPEYKRRLLALEGIPLP